MTEGKIARPADIRELEVVEHAAGIEARMWLAPGAGRGAADRRRAMLGPTGCGLCGIDSLEAALPRPAARRSRRHPPSRRHRRGRGLGSPGAGAEPRGPRSTPPASGRPRKASSPCARTSAATTPSTSSSAPSPAPAPTPARASS
ncbi:MAG: hypothetical protein U1E59_14500 [Amaricoccus sp.]